MAHITSKVSPSRASVGGKQTWLKGFGHPQPGFKVEGLGIFSDVWWILLSGRAAYAPYAPGKYCNNSLPVVEYVDRSAVSKQTRVPFLGNPQK